MEILNAETALFSVIGWALLLGSAATVLVPVLVWIGNVICAGLWHFIDEGETDYKDRFTFTYLTGLSAGKVEKTKNGWVIRAGSLILDRSDLRFEDRAYRSSYFETEAQADSYLKENRKRILEVNKHRWPCDMLEVSCHTYAILLLTPLGVGLLLIPTITLVAGSALLSLYAMRWARRGVKLAKKVKGSLESHIADKNAHKE